MFIFIFDATEQPTIVLNTILKYKSPINENQTIRIEKTTKIKLGVANLTQIFGYT